MPVKLILCRCVVNSPLRTLIAPLVYILLKFWHFVTHLFWHPFSVFFPSNIKPFPINLKSNICPVMLVLRVTILYRLIFHVCFCTLVPSSLALTLKCRQRRPVSLVRRWRVCLILFLILGFIMCLGSSPPVVYCISQPFGHSWHGHFHGQFTIYDEDDISSVWIHWQTSGNAAVPG